MAKYNHKNAQDIYKQVDPDKKLYTNILEKIQNRVMIPGFIEEVGQDISSECLNSKELTNKYIASAEAIYQILERDEIVHGCGQDYISGKSQDQLFNMILDNLFYGLKEEEFNNILGEVQNVYGTEI